MTSAAPAPEERRTIASVVPLVPAWRVGREFDYEIPEKLADKVRAGTLVRVPFGNRKVRGIVTSVHPSAPDRALEKIASVVIETPVAPAPLVELLWWLARRYVSTPSRAFEKVVPPRVRVTPGAMGERFPKVTTDALAGYQGATDLLSALSDRRGGTHLIQLVPGADRTKVIGQLAAAAGPGVIVTVPEVRYGSAVLEGLADGWGGVRVDSGLGDQERSRGWVEAASGASLVLGGRAAVFAPVPELRLIVVDEEHHPTYKERSHAALRRQGCRPRRAPHCLGLRACSLVNARASKPRSQHRAARTVRCVLPRRCCVRRVRSWSWCRRRPTGRCHTNSTNGSATRSERGGVSGYWHRHVGSRVPSGVPRAGGP